MSTPSMNHRSNFERLEARISTEKKSLLKYAADLVGRSLTDFVVNSAYEAASQVIKEHEQIKLSMEESISLINALQASKPPSKTLIAASKRYKKDVISK